MDTDTDTLAAALMAKASKGRTVIAVAGPPGSGKSTFADALVQEINQRQPGFAAVLPMDGFHYDDHVLKELGRLLRKGAIDTFDVGGLFHMLKRLRSADEETVAVPVFDRSIEIARAGGRLISKETPLIVVEGNYLLIKDDPWSCLKPLFDVTIAIKTDVEVLRQRLTDRWQSAGFDDAEIRRRVENNDLPNGIVVLEKSVEADYCVMT